MSLKKFLVNARTKILEFKKKHNLLAEEVEKVPNLIESAIKADKNILSKIKIEYDEEGNRTIFSLPKNVLPLRAYFGDNYANGKNIYFDYDNSSMYDDDYNSVGGVDILYNQVILSFPVSLSDISIYSELEYIPFEGGSILNTYYIYNPITSGGGTKLYLHKIRGSGRIKLTNSYTEDFDSISLDIISPVSTDITSFSDIVDEKSNIIATDFYAGNSSFGIAYAIKQAGYQRLTLIAYIDGSGYPDFQYFILRSTSIVSLTLTDTKVEL